MFWRVKKKIFEHKCSFFASFTVFYFKHNISIVSDFYVYVCEKLSNCWEPLPHYFIKLDCRSILQDDAIENVSKRIFFFAFIVFFLIFKFPTEVEMGEADNTGSQVSDEVVEKSESAKNDHDNDIFDLSKSKWDNHDMSEDRLSLCFTLNS
jgi:hypothetical protein